MGFNGALAICLQLKRSANTGTSYMGGFSGFFSSGSGSNAAINTKNRLPYAVYNAVEQISNDIAKMFSVNQKNGNNRESKPNHPAHKLVSFRLTA
jgi:phage portal protein BeeE